MVVVINRLTARDAGVAAHIEARFRDRARTVEGQPGFLSFELWRDAANPLVILSVSRWKSKADFEAWTASDAFRKAHARHGEAAPGGPPAMTSEVSVHEVILGGI